jgi:hypothetical protein
VLRVNRIDAGYPVGYVMDLLGLDGRLDVVEGLAGFAVGWFGGLGVGVVHAQLVGGHVYEGVLGRYGFLDSRVKPYLQYQLAGIGASDLEAFKGASVSKLYYNYGESDAI